MSEDSPAAQVGASCSTEGNEAPKKNRWLLPSSPTGKTFSSTFPTRFPSLAPAMLLCCWQPRALLPLKNQGLHGTQGSRSSPGLSRTKDPLCPSTPGHPAANVPCPGGATNAPAALRQLLWRGEGLAKLGQEKGRKTKGFGKKQKEAHKGRKKKSRVRA